ncbi:hypothetical protein AAVH_37477, partial [Aphelenchoides avenae]
CSSRSECSRDKGCAESACASRATLHAVGDQGPTHQRTAGLRWHGNAPAAEDGMAAGPRTRQAGGRTTGATAAGRKGRQEGYIHTDLQSRTNVIPVQGCNPWRNAEEVTWDWMLT